MRWVYGLVAFLLSVHGPSLNGWSANGTDRVSTLEEVTTALEKLRSSPPEEFDNTTLAVARINALIDLKDSIVPIAPLDFGTKTEDFKRAVESMRSSITIMTEIDCSKPDFTRDISGTSSGYTQSFNNASNAIINIPNDSQDNFQNIKTSLGISQYNSDGSSKTCDTFKKDASDKVGLIDKFSTSGLNILAAQVATQKEYLDKIGDLKREIDARLDQIEVVNAESRLIINKLGLLLGIVVAGALIALFAPLAYPERAQRQIIASRQLIETMTVVALLGSRLIRATIQAQP